MSTSTYRIFGLELSPYSVKVRSYFRYKAIPHAWIVRNSENAAEYQKYAKLPGTNLLWMDRCSTLASVRGDPRFDALVAHAKERAAAAREK